MERQQFIDIINRELEQSLTTQDIVSVLDSFCRTKKGYDQRLVEWCIAQLLRSNGWYQYYVYAKEHFLTEFNVVTWYDKEKEVMTPLGPQKQREIIRYF